MLFLKDVLCYIAVVYGVDRTHYDYFELAPLQPYCDITEQEEIELMENAEAARFESAVAVVVEVYIYLHIYYMAEAICRAISPGQYSLLILPGDGGHINFRILNIDFM